MSSSCCKSAGPNSGACCSVKQGSTWSRDSKNLVDVVNSAYSAKAREGVEATYANRVAEAFGYTAEQLQSVPDGAHMGLSCGNPIATATIQEGETVVDLGSGGGIDVFLAAEKVGTTGQVIGLDMSSDMIDLARKNAAKKGLKPPHVSFVQALLTEPLPIESESVDCILSNCVVNLLPLDGKVHLFKEMHRILKSGGRIVLDDIVARKTLPDNTKRDVTAYVGCVAGAITEDQYRLCLAEAYFTEILVVDNKHDLNVYFRADEEAAATSTCPGSHGTDIHKMDYDANEWAASCSIYASKNNKSTSNLSTAVQSKPALLRWWDAYPKVKATSTPHMRAEDVAKLIRDSAAAGKEPDFAVIDVRRADHGGGHVRGSYNYHAQSFYDELPSFYEKFKDTKKVIFYCQSSNGRGPRCAGWYQDYLDTQPADGHDSKAYVLQGGVKNWLKVFQGEEDLIDQD